MKTVGAIVLTAVLYWMLSEIATLRLEVEEHRDLIKLLIGFSGTQAELNKYLEAIITCDGNCEIVKGGVDWKLKCRQSEKSQTVPKFL